MGSLSYGFSLSILALSSAFSRASVELVNLFARLFLRLRFLVCRCRSATQFMYKNPETFDLTSMSP
jgi:hypothetical protein